VLLPPLDGVHVGPEGGLSPSARAIARGRTSKLHALSDGQGRLRVLLLTAGNINDVSLARALLRAAGPIRRLIADRGYDANHLRQFLTDQQAEAVIPSTASRRTAIP
jgi:transposase